MGRKVDVTITYLEQRTRIDSQSPQKALPGVTIMRAERPTVHFYRYLYASVGDQYCWVSRKRTSDADLAHIIQNPDTYIKVLYVDGVPAGFAEIDAREGVDIEVKFFGLIPDYTGRGLGRYFFAQIVDFAWSLEPSRVRLETCTLDHPAALPLYQKFGFTVFDRQKGQVELMED